MTVLLASNTTNRRRVVPSQQSLFYLGIVSASNHFHGSFSRVCAFQQPARDGPEPTCAFYATDKDWRNRFNRTVKETATPMVILAPMHPILLVYDIDSTEGQPFPAELTEFKAISGTPEPKLLKRLIRNCHRYGITVIQTLFSEGKRGFVRKSRDPKRKLVATIDRSADIGGAEFLHFRFFDSRHEFEMGKNRMVKTKAYFS